MLQNIVCAQYMYIVIVCPSHMQPKCKPLHVLIQIGRIKLPNRTAKKHIGFANIQLTAKIKRKNCGFFSAAAKPDLKYCRVEMFSDKLSLIRIIKYAAHAQRVAKCHLFAQAWDRPV
jgi:hypothetical protein